MHYIHDCAAHVDVYPLKCRLLLVHDTVLLIICTLNKSLHMGEKRKGRPFYHENSSVSQAELESGRDPEGGL